MRGDRDDVGQVLLEFELHMEILLLATTKAGPQLSPQRVTAGLLPKPARGSR
jgi:hypothetical protein